MKVRMMGNGKCHNKVAAIKAYRTLSGAGLKDAKDAVEAALDGEIVEMTIRPAHVAALVEGVQDDSLDTLRDQGFTFGGLATKRTAIIQALRDSAKVSLDSKDYDLAISIIGVLKDHDFVQ